MERPFSDAALWTVIAGLAFGSYFLRFAFLGLVGGREIPEPVLRHLRYTAVGIIPALVTPLAVWPDATGGATDPARLAAALVTLGISYWRKSVLWGVLAGASTLIGLVRLGF